MSKDTGGPAFPINDERLPSFEGMTLRDWFAGQCLNSMVIQLGNHLPDKATNEHFAELAFQLADAMLAERKK